MAKKPKLGTKMPDGTILFALLDDEQALFAAPEDGPTGSFNKAATYTEHLQVGDKNDFFMPDLEQARLLRAALNVDNLRGTFNLTKSYAETHPGATTPYDPYGITPAVDSEYWTSSWHGEGYVHTQRMSDGYQGNTFYTGTAHVRAIRKGPLPI